VKPFNIVITGIGGQGVLTVAAVLAEAGVAAGLDVKGAELHGLSMRFGPLECHLRFGQNIHSPLVTTGGAELIIGLERLETLRALPFAYNKTKIIFDTRAAVPPIFFINKLEYPTEKKAIISMKKITRKVISVKATDAVKASGFDPVMANIYLLGRAVAEKALPISKKDVLVGLKKIVPERALDANMKVFDMGFASR
jgi:indolepyruvate ferredoxin oxidoreductase beta subunit